MRSGVAYKLYYTIRGGLEVLLYGQVLGVRF